jgi:glycosyltransferase involved in cell wall biosynthesis
VRDPIGLLPSGHHRQWSEGHGTGSPDVSVVIPTHNRIALLAVTLRTALWQEGVNLEVIVVDDGSTDGTSEMVEKINDSRVRLVRHTRPKRVSAARNAGLEIARGEWTAFLDDDDVWAPHKLTLQVRAAREVGRLWAYAGSVNVTTDHRILGGAPPAPPEVVAEGLPRTNLIPGGCSNTVVRTDVVRRIGGFDVGLGILEDWDMWIRLAGEGMPAWVRQPLIGYRIHPGNSSLKTAQLMAELALIEDRYGGPVDRLRFYRYLARVSLRGGQRRQALRYYARAAMTSRRYLLHEFVPEVGEVVRTFLPRGGPFSSIPLGRRHRDHEIHDWQMQARAWLDQLRRAFAPPVGSGPDGVD